MSDTTGAAATITGCFTLPTMFEFAKIGGSHGVLSDDEVREFVVQSLAGCDVDGRSVCVIVPDATRSGPLPLLVDAVHRSLAGRASAITVLIALGTHAEMSEPRLAAHLGYPVDGVADRLAAFAADPDTLFLPRAGEVLYRLRSMTH